MTLNSIAERISLLPDGGVLNSANRFDRGYIWSIIHTAAAQAKQIDFIKNNRRIHSSWLYPYYPEFVQAAQVRECFNRFNLPQIIEFDSRMTGVGYVGAITGNNAYRVIENRARFTSMQNDRIMKVRKDKNYVLIENGYIELYGMAENMMVMGCWFDVTKIPSYNVEKDDYPISANLIPEVEKLIEQANLNIIMRNKPDFDERTMVDSSALMVGDNHKGGRNENYRHGAGH